MRLIRNPARRELLGLIAGLLISPLAFVAIAACDAWLLSAALQALGTPLDPPDQDLAFLFAREPGNATMVAYVYSAIVIFPPILLLRARNWLCGWTAVGSAVWIPLSGAAMMTLLFGYLANAVALDMLKIFAFLCYLIVPGAGATAMGFWLVYRSLSAPRAMIERKLPDCAEVGFT